MRRRGLRSPGPKFEGIEEESGDPGGEAMRLKEDAAAGGRFCIGVVGDASYQV